MVQVTPKFLIRITISHTVLLAWNQGPETYVPFMHMREDCPTESSCLREDFPLEQPQDLTSANNKRPITYLALSSLSILELCCSSCHCSQEQGASYCIMNVQRASVSASQKIRSFALTLLPLPSFFPVPSMYVLSTSSRA